MFSRRLATFLLGIWMGCSVLVNVLALQGQRVADQILTNPSPESKAIVDKAGQDPTALMLRHLANEQTRWNLSHWEGSQLVVAGAMLMLLIFTEQRKPVAIGLCVLMAVLVAIQHYAITPEFSFRWRESDYLAPNEGFELRSRVWTMTQTYGILEGFKLLLGGVLASYFFAMESMVKRSRGRSRARGEETTSSTVAAS